MSTRALEIVCALATLYGFLGCVFTFEANVKIDTGRPFRDGLLELVVFFGMILFWPIYLAGKRSR